MERIKLSSTETQIVVAIILQAVKPCTIYIFGKRQESTELVHFYVLVLTDTTVTGTHLMNEIQQRTDRTVSATVLVHKPKHLATKDKSQQYFFDQILRYGQRIWLDSGNVPYLIEHQPERNLEADSAFWQKCVAVALFNLQAAKEHPQEEVVLCKIALLNGACVQLALGLIRVYLGYSPREYGLRYLMALCSHFTTLPDEVFPQNSIDDIRCYTMLCAPAGMLLHWRRLNGAEADFEVLLERTELFLDRAREQAANELNQLKTLN